MIDDYIFTRIFLNFGRCRKNEIIVMPRPTINKNMGSKITPEITPAIRMYMWVMNGIQKTSPGSEVREKCGRNVMTEIKANENVTARNNL
jgi:hypothetical protein